MPRMWGGRWRISFLTFYSRNQVSWFRSDKTLSRSALSSSDIQPVRRFGTSIYSTKRCDKHSPATFKKYGIGVKFVHRDDPRDFQAAIDEKTKAIYIKSIDNPKYNVAPLPEIAKIAHDHCIPLIVNNTFGCEGTSFGQSPLARILSFTVPPNGLAVTEPLLWVSSSTLVCV
ncbi:hypothetical protein JVT61DRAFT_6119 [Boletus reticuloceps]|uniref:Uncharacterized protein n=1 Tax=Boletus reticuloceps TaxID=495285 RepID=A0A8I3A8X1_9AGAM|nr:hypothetical protein JVT61DRAFT_6119 [Boletus reticuloceps]